jgi:type VI secretion system secreted protein VgrG
MEEEGIFYFFKHTSSGHQMVLANTPQSHPAVPFLPSTIWEGGAHATTEENRVFDWNKGQEIRSGKFTAWDYNFEMPDKNLEANKTITDSVAVGTVTHKLKVASNDSLELYDYPGGYASRFDGINKSGGEQADKLQHIFPTTRVRWKSACRKRRYRACSSGVTEDTRVSPGAYLRSDAALFGQRQVRDHQRAARCQAGAGGGPGGWRIPVCQPFHLHSFGTALPAFARDADAECARVQTAVVVGPSGDEIYVDKYGRVKVQFHWDREGQADVNSSCWVRVATFWAGTQWGSIHPAHRPGSDCGLCGRRCESADHRGQRVQRGPDAALDAA